MGVLGKLASKQGKLLTELKADMGCIIEGLSDTWQIKELLLEFKKDRAFSGGR